LEEKKCFLRTANFGLVDYTNVEFSLNINKAYRSSHCPALIKHLFIIPIAIMLSPNSHANGTGLSYLQLQI